MELAVSALQPHPRNAAIYGDEADADLIASVRAQGILTPLLVTRDNRIISGHRRWHAAKRIGLTAVPVTVFSSEDELGILAALVESNRFRAKSNLQLGREAEALLEIEEGLARRRQQEAGEQHGRNREEKVQAILPGAFKGQARDKVGEQLGISGHKAERAVQVVRAIDSLEAAGKQRQAGQLRATLNDRSVQRAYAQAVEAGQITPAARPVKREDRLVREVVTLDEWRALDADARAGVLATPRRADFRFRAQDNDGIEWALWSWNPVTGCKHDCSYCYARDIAARLYPHGFVPAFIPSRLGAPENTAVPLEAARNVAHRNVFTCSMADLFGRWVPREWIDAVLATARTNPQWNFLFLTKFPIRLSEFTFPPNAWIGTTVDAQARVFSAEKAFANLQGGVKWLSCEPLLEDLHFSRLDLFDWVVIGGASRSTQTPEFRPPRSWVEHLEQQARDAGCRVYEKANLLDRLKEYPGAPEEVRIVVPTAFRMGYLQRDVLDGSTYDKEMASS